MRAWNTQHWKLGGVGSIPVPSNLCVILGKSLDFQDPIDLQVT